MLTPDKLTELYLRLKDHQVLFGNAISDEEKLNQFINSFMEHTPHGLVARGIIWEVDDVGIFFLTEVDEDAGTASAHYAFWDRRFRGRERLCREMVKYIFTRFDLRKLNARIPLHAWRAFFTAEAIGFKKEGRIRQEAYYDGQWFDVNYYSLLREEVLSNGTGS